MRTLILTSSTGGGHNMRASSFVHWTRESAGTAVASEIQIHKCLENTHALYRFGVGLYNRIQRHAPWAHHVYFNFLEVAGLHYSRHRLLGTERFRAILDHVRPRVVLSTHGSLNHGFFDLAREHLGRENVRCITYCGELFGQYGFSRHWVNPRADLFIGAVPETVAMARTLGMPRDRAVVGGFMLNPSFYHPPLTPDERGKFLQSLGLNPDKFTLLLSTGEHGANNHLAFLEALRTKRPRKDLQVIALCGRDPRELDRVRSWGRRHKGVLPVLALPHSHMMHLLMQAASAVVGRPGTGTTSEAIISGCPIIFNALGGFMPQEYITLRYARRHGIAAEVYRPDDLPTILARWSSHPNDLAVLRRRLLECVPTAQPRDILRMVADQASHLPPEPPHHGPRAPYVQLEEDPRFSPQLRLGRRTAR